MAIYSGFFPLKMVIFHSYVSLPEGICCFFLVFRRIFSGEASLFFVKPGIFFSEMGWLGSWGSCLHPDPAGASWPFQRQKNCDGPLSWMIYYLYIYIVYIYIIYLFKMIMFNSYVSLLETNAESWVWPVILTHVMISQFMAKLLSLRWIMMTFTQGFFHWWQWKHGNIEVITYKDGLKHMLFSHMSFSGRASMNITRVTWSRIEYQGFDPWQDGWFSWPRDPAGGCNFFFQVIWGWVNTYQ